MIDPEGPLGGCVCSVGKLFEAPRDLPAVLGELHVCLSIILS